MKRQNVFMIGRKGATSWGDPGLTRDLLHLKKFKLK